MADRLERLKSNLDSVWVDLDDGQRAALRDGVERLVAEIRGVPETERLQNLKGVVDRIDGGETAQAETVENGEPGDETA